MAIHYFFGFGGVIAVFGGRVSPAAYNLSSHHFQALDRDPGIDFDSYSMQDYLGELQYNETHPHDSEFSAFLESSKSETTWCASQAEVEPLCCCQRHSLSKPCPGVFHPGVKPTDPDSFSSDTCEPVGLCCSNNCTPQFSWCSIKHRLGFKKQKCRPRRWKDMEHDARLCDPKGSNNNSQNLLDIFPAEVGDDVSASDAASKFDGTNVPVFLRILAQKPNQAKEFMRRDYTLIIDRSGSMGTEDRVHVPKQIADSLKQSEGDTKLSRWKQVEGALHYLAPYVVAEDPDGISVFFFSNVWDEHTNICADKDVDALFRKNRPGGGTRLADVLASAMEPDSIGRAETIFVLTDGAANDQNQVKSEIIAYTKKMCRPEMLSISFIQVGTDRDAAEFLESLDDDLMSKTGSKNGRGAKFDIVDAMTVGEMQDKSFLDILTLSVYD